MIVVDDMGSADLGMHGSGIQSPTLDNLAAEGLYLDNFYVTPKCTHSRTALMTGRYPYRMGIYTTVSQKHTFGVPPEEEFLSEVLLQANYATHAVGKWQ